MKILSLYVFILLLFSCKSNNSYYSGYIYNYNQKPIEGIRIIEESSLKNFTTTNSKGFFYLKRKKKWISNLLIGFNKLDTIRTIGSQGGERIKYFFINNNKDTLFIKQKKSNYR